jgi:hypothetical protein
LRLLRRRRRLHRPLLLWRRRRRRRRLHRPLLLRRRRWRRLHRALWRRRRRTRRLSLRRRRGRGRPRRLGLRRGGRALRRPLLLLLLLLLAALLLFRGQRGLRQSHRRLADDRFAGRDAGACQRPGPRQNRRSQKQLPELSHGLSPQSRSHCRCPHAAPMWRFDGPARAMRDIPSAQNPKVRNVEPGNLRAQRLLAHGPPCRHRGITAPPAPGRPAGQALAPAWRPAARAAVPRLRGDRCAPAGSTAPT